MALAPWRSSLARALHRNRALVNSRYLQLATVQAGDRPANRTIVFRDFWAETNQLKFVTDIRSEKVGQILLNPWAEACWYFPKTREQFRLLGRLTLIDAQQRETTLQTERTIAWQAMSDNARSQFAWAHPGQLRDTADTFAPPPPNVTEPLPNFCLLLLDPTQVDHLELRGDPQNRWIYRLESNGWQTQAINP